MNTLTRMVLIPEDQYSRRCRRGVSKLFDINPIMNSDLPHGQKVRLINELMLLKTNVKPSLPLEQQMKPIISSNLSSNMKIKLLQKILDKPKEALEEPTFVYEEDEQNKYEETDDDSELFATPRSGSAVELSTSFETPKAIATLPKISQDEMVRRITRYQDTKEAIQKEKDSVVLALRDIPGLFSTDGKVINKEGTVYKTSDIKNIVDFMFNETGVMRTPHGLPHVLSVIKEKKPELLKFVRNPNFSTLPSWRALSKQLGTVTYRQTAQEVSEESDASIT